MTDTWEKYDEFVEKSLVQTRVNTGILHAQLTVLLVKRVVTYQTSVVEIQQALKTRYNVEYTFEDVHEEIISMAFEETQTNTYVLNSEDYFEGF